MRKRNTVYAFWNGLRWNFKQVNSEFESLNLCDISYVKIYGNIETAERYSEASYDEGHREKAIQKYDQLYKIFDNNLWLHTTF